MRILLLLLMAGTPIALTPCGMIDFNPFLLPRGLSVILNQTDSELTTECTNIFAVRQLSIMCNKLQQQQKTAMQTAHDATLLHTYVCPQRLLTLREQLKVCVSASERQLPFTATADAVRTHVLFCYHHFTCTLATLQKDCEDGRFWLARRLVDVCFESPARKGKGALFKEVVAQCETSFGKPINDTVAEVLDQVSGFVVTGQADVPDKAAFQQHLTALSALQKAQADALQREREREALFSPDDADDDGTDISLDNLEEYLSTCHTSSQSKAKRLYSVV